VLLRALPIALGLLTAHVLVLLGALPGPAAGAPPLPGAVGFDALAGLAVALVALVAGVATWQSRRFIRRLRVAPAAEGAAAPVLLTLVVLAAFAVSPYALVLILPAAHAGLLATGARRPWHLAALGLLAVAPLFALCATLGGRLDRNPGFAFWYLLETTAAGARGATGPVLAVLAAACVWALGGLAAFRARKGAVAATARSGGPRRPW
jgi:hypothetical protein